MRPQRKFRSEEEGWPRLIRRLARLVPGFIFFFAFIAVLICLPEIAFASDIKVIANSTVTVDTISADELANIFMQGKNSLHDGSHVEPVLQKQGPTHRAFLRDVLHQSDDSLQNSYRALVFTGKGSMPKAFSSDAEVVAYVAKTNGAIGYVSADADTQGVKTLVIIDARTGTERKLVTRIEPLYPETLKRLQIGGTVRLKLTIAPAGNVERVELIGGNPILAEAAMVAVKQWRYGPAHSRTNTQIAIPFDPH
jgi:TonB family protein